MIKVQSKHSGAVTHSSSSGSRGRGWFFSGAVDWRSCPRMLMDCLHDAHYFLLVNDRFCFLCLSLFVVFLLGLDDGQVVVVYSLAHTSY